jgi:mannose-6-phosphate isomerase-like protein (cupin superfamily)
MFNETNQVFIAVSSLAALLLQNVQDFGKNCEIHSPLASLTLVSLMSDQEDDQYHTRLNVHYGPLEVIEVEALAKACLFRWYNQTLCEVNGSVVRLGVLEGEYHWHRHESDDEFFYVVEGQLLIDLEDRTIALAPRQGFVVPRNVQHRTRALERTVILMVENAGIIPTGN